MITIKIQAGLGNQMFQYAFAKAIKERTKKDITLDLSFYTPNGIAAGDTVRYFDLDKFDLDLEKDFILSYKPTLKKISILEKIKRKLFNESGLVFYKKYLYPKDGSYLIGFWQTEKYFKDIENTIRSKFVLKNKIEDQENTEARLCLDKINSSKISISINVRRGDYATVKHINHHHGLLSTKYFRDSLERVLEILKKQNNNLDLKDINVFIFSDDIKWCEDNFNFINKNMTKIFVPDNLLPHETLYLISKCQNNIIANSSFSWWGAWLNNYKEKIIIRPANWMANKSINTKDVCPESWIKIENDFDFI